MAKTYKLGKGQSLNPAEVHICIQYKLFEKNENNKTEAGMPLEMQLTTVVLIQERANFGRSNNQTKSNVTKYWQHSYVEIGRYSGLNHKYPDVEDGC